MKSIENAHSEIANISNSLPINVSSQSLDGLRELADDYLLARKEVERITTLSRATIYRLIALKKFPRPRKISPNRVGWTVGEIREWLRTRPF